MAHALHPGAVRSQTASREVSGMLANFPGLPFLVRRIFVRFLWRSPDAGARTLLFAALSSQPKVMMQGGQYLDSMCRPFLEQPPEDWKDDDDLRVTLQLPGNKTLTVYTDPVEALRAADMKCSSRLWDVSLALLQDSPASAVVELAP